MKAVRTHGRGGPEQLFFEDAPVPVVRPGDVLVRVRATGITPAELSWDETYQNADGTPRIPGIPGHEPSGVVEETAPDVTDFRAGDEIYGLADFPRDGAAARVRGSACGEPRVKATQHPACAGGGTAAFGADRLAGALSNTRISLRGKPC